MNIYNLTGFDPVYIETEFPISAVDYTKITITGVDTTNVVPGAPDIGTIVGASSSFVVKTNVIELVRSTEWEDGYTYTFTVGADAITFTDGTKNVSVVSTFGVAGAGIAYVAPVAVTFVTMKLRGLSDDTIVFLPETTSADEPYLKLRYNNSKSINTNIDSTKASVYDTTPWFEEVLDLSSTVPVVGELWYIPLDGLKRALYIKEIL